MENKVILEKARANAVEVISTDPEFQNLPRGKQFCHYKMIVRSEYEYLMAKIEQEILNKEFEQDLKKMEAIWKQYPVEKKSYATT